MQKNVYFYVLKCRDKAYYSCKQNLTISAYFLTLIPYFWFLKVGSPVLVKQTSVSLTIRGRGGVGLSLRGHAASACLLPCMRSHTAPVLRNLHLRHLTRRHTLWVGFS